MTDRYIIKTLWFSPRPLGGKDKHITFVERDEAEMGWGDTVSDIASGQVSDVVQVIKFNEIEHTCQDVTEMAARAILDTLDHAPAGDLLDFLENALTCQVMAEFVREVA